MLRLTNDPADGSYSVDVAVTINDSLGASPTTTRTFSETVGFVGQEFSWDDAYYYDLVDCSGKLRGYARQALRQLRDPGLRPPGPGGDPPVGPWIEEHPERYRPVDLPDVRDLAHLAHYLQNARPEIANNIASLLKGYERVAGAQ
jgi:hypothetical protein